MSNFLLMGSLVALILGVFNATYLYGLVSHGAGTVSSDSRVSALNFALWTCALWILVGVYLLGFWLIAVVFYLVFKAFR